MSFVLTLVLLSIVFGLLFWLRNRDREKVAKVEHEYFSLLWL